MGRGCRARPVHRGAPHDSCALPGPVVVLIATDRPWVAWWVGDPADRRLEIGVCLRAAHRAGEARERHLSPCVRPGCGYAGPRFLKW
jgi:hypothetical protein